MDISSGAAAAHHITCAYKIYSKFPSNIGLFTNDQRSKMVKPLMFIHNVFLLFIHALVHVKKVISNQQTPLLGGGCLRFILFVGACLILLFYYEHRGRTKNQKFFFIVHKNIMLCLILSVRKLCMCGTTKFLLT